MVWYSNNNMSYWNNTNVLSQKMFPLTPSNPYYPYDNDCEAYMREDDGNAVEMGMHRPLLFDLMKYGSGSAKESHGICIGVMG